MMRSIHAPGKRGKRATLIVLVALILSGCHSRVSISVEPRPPTAAVFTQAKLKAGDKLRVTLQNGARASFVLAETQADALVARDGRQFPYADIAGLEKTHVSTAKMIALGVAISVAIAIPAAVLTVGW